MIALDLGSNSIRIGKFAKNKHLEMLDYYSEVTTISDKVLENGYINNEAIARTINAIKNAQKKIDFDRDVLAYTTEGLRKASNKDEVLSTIKKETNVSFHIIDGDKEANLVENIMAYELDKKKISKNFVMLDMGGGSSEIAFHNEKIVDERIVITSKRKSFKIGIVTFTQAKNKKEFLSKIIKEVDEFIQEAKKEGFASDIFLSTSGGSNTVAAVVNDMSLKDYIRSDLNFTKVSKKDILDVRNKFSEIGDEETAKFVGINRVKFMNDGLKLLHAFFGKISDESIVLKEGLLEGIALEFFTKNEVTKGQS